MFVTTLGRGLARSVSPRSASTRMWGINLARGYSATSATARSDEGRLSHRHPSASVTTRLLNKDEVTTAERKGVVDVLTNSFLSFPEHTDVFGPDPKINRTLVESAVAHTLAKHKVWVAEKDANVVGAGLWTEPGAVWFTEEDLPAIFGPVMELLESERLQWLMGVMLPGQEEMEQRLVPNCANDWYFGAMLGVDPSMQGHGVGKQIMREIIKVAGPTPVAFHTQGKKNLNFYGQLGFVVREEQDFILPNGKVWPDRLMVIDTAKA